MNKAFKTKTFFYRGLSHQELTLLQKGIMKELKNHDKRMSKLKRTERPDCEGVSWRCYCLAA